MAPSVKSDKKSAPKKKSSAKKTKPMKSRAALRLIEAGSTADCPFCGEPVKYKARQRDMQVICNIYEKGVWQRVEQYHRDCYEEAGSPYGEPQEKNKTKPKGKSK